MSCIKDRDELKKTVDGYRQNKIVIIGEEKMKIETRIKLDRFKPREYQLPLFDAIENKGYKRALLIWPRRARPSGHINW